MSHTGKCDMTAGVIFMLLKAPRTIPELCHLLDTDGTTVSRHIKALADEGIVREIRPHRPGPVGVGCAAQYAWVLKPEYEVTA